VKSKLHLLDHSILHVYLSQTVVSEDPTLPDQIFLSNHTKLAGLPGPAIFTYTVFATIVGQILKLKFSPVSFFALSNQNQKTEQPQFRLMFG